MSTDQSKDQASLGVSLFGGRVVGAFYGRQYGNCQTDPPIESAVRRVDDAVKSLGAKTVVLPRIGHGTNILDLGRGGVYKLLPKYQVWKTAVEHDGLITTDKGQALAIANADCPVGVIYHQPSNWLCLLHLGIKCLLAKPNIIDRALELAPEPASKLSFEFGFGIRSCCYGYTEGHEHLLAVRDVARCALNGQVQKGPRRGQMSINLPSVIWSLTHKRFGGTVAIIGGSVCTACREDVPAYSNVWSQIVVHEKGHRNLFIVQLAP